MTYRATAGLGAVRPSWCPVHTLPPGAQDPCAIEYPVDLPIIGSTTMNLPIDAMTNDALFTIERQLPQILDRQLPMVWTKLQPYIASVMADAQVMAREEVDHAMKTLLPVVQTQEADVIAKAEVVVEKAVLGLAVVGALGVGAWLYFRKP